MSYTNGLDNPELYFQTKLYTGNGGTQAITFDGSENMQPDFIWCKSRNNVRHHYLADVIRGVKSRLRSDANNSEYTANSTSGFDSFDSDGFTLEEDSSSLGLNESGHTMVSWNWKESATAGFDIVSYTGNSSDGVTQQNISHSLSAVPQVIIIKNRADATNWCVYHHKNTSAPETEVIYLNASNATSDDSAFFGDTAPTSSIFTVGGDNGVNGNGDSMIAYCFAEKKGYSKFGSYTGNGNSDGTFVYTGFRPAWFLVKRTDGSDHWTLWDNKRETTMNPNDNVLYPSTNGAESSSDTSYACDFLSNGIKWRGTSTGMNTSGGTYIYIAFAESPFVNSNGVPTTAR